MNQESKLNKCDLVKRESFANSTKLEFKYPEIGSLYVLILKYTNSLMMMLTDADQKIGATASVEVGGPSQLSPLMEQEETPSVSFSLEYTLGKETSQIFSFFLRNLSLRISARSQKAIKSLPGQEQILAELDPQGGVKPTRIVYTCGIKEKKGWSNGEKIQFYKALQNAILDNFA